MAEELKLFEGNRIRHVYDEEFIAYRHKILEEIQMSLVNQ